MFFYFTIRGTLVRAFTRTDKEKNHEYNGQTDSSFHYFYHIFTMIFSLNFVRKRISVNNNNFFIILQDYYFKIQVFIYVKYKSKNSRELEAYAQRSV